MNKKRTFATTLALDGGAPLRTTPMPPWPVIDDEAIGSALEVLEASWFYEDAHRKIFSAILEMERWNLGFSYDVNASSLKKASQARGGFEVSLIYVHPTRERFKVNCPKF